MPLHYKFIYQEPPPPQDEQPPPQEEHPPPQDEQLPPEELPPLVYNPFLNSLSILKNKL